VRSNERQEATVWAFEKRCGITTRNIVVINRTLLDDANASLRRTF
jgi:hypothetical protein